MNEELYNYIDTLREDTMMAMDEYQTPEMAFTSTVLEKIEDLLDCKEITKEHCVITKSDGSVTGEISSLNGDFTIPMGFHDGSGKVTIADTEAAKIIEGNIKAGVEILGVTGTYGGEEISAQSKSVTPRTTAQTVQPDTGYDYLSAVTVAAIPYTESDNSAGGKTVTIGG